MEDWAGLERSPLGLYHCGQICTSPYPMETGGLRGDILAFSQQHCALSYLFSLSLLDCQCSTPSIEHSILSFWDSIFIFYQACYRDKAFAQKMVPVIEISILVYIGPVNDIWIEEQK